MGGQAFMNLAALLTKLIEIERSIGVDTDTAVRRKLSTLDVLVKVNGAVGYNTSAYVGWINAQ